MLSKIKDGFVNVMKGLGTTKDPRTQNTYVRGMRITQQIANDLYVYNWLASKIVDIPIDDATRKGRNIMISDPEKKKGVEQYFKDHKMMMKVNIAAKWARVFGGSVILAVIEGDDQAEPLDLDRVKPGSLKNLIVLDRYSIEPQGVNTDILDENFGQPEYYIINRGGQPIHHTRLVKFDGVVPTLRELEEQNYWGTSLFTKQLEPITDSQTTSQSIADLIYESNVDVFRIKGLNGAVAEGRDDVVVKRLKLASEMKSVLNGIALDSEDEYEKKTNTFTTLPEIDDRFMQKVAGAADIPITRLLGISPAGQNATGESDMLNYYDNVQSLQENVLRSRIDWLDSVILANAGFKDPFEYEFRPLKQLTEIEQADTTLKRAQRDQIYIDLDIINTTDVMAQLAEDGTYVTVDENRVAAEQSEMDLDYEED